MDLNTGHSLCCHFLVSGRYEITLYRCSSVSAFWDCLRTAAVWNAPTRSSATCWGLVVWISVVDGPYDKFDEQQQSWSTMMTASLVKACQFIVFVGPPHVVFVITHKLGHSDLDQCAILVPSLSTFNFLRVMTCWQEVDGHSVILHHCHAIFAMKITVTLILYLLNFHALRVLLSVDCGCSHDKSILHCQQELVHYCSICPWPGCDGSPVRWLKSVDNGQHFQQLQFHLCSVLFCQCRFQHPLCGQFHLHREWRISHQIWVVCLCCIIWLTVCFWVESFLHPSSNVVWVHNDIEIYLGEKFSIGLTL